MSVASALGLQDLDRGELVQAADAWARWQSEHPVLGACDSLAHVPGWVRSVHPEEANELLLALGQLGAVDGGDEPAACSALIWLLLPGAASVVAGLSGVRDIDQLVASQLWICTRTVNWRGRVRVAATVLMNTRRDVLRELQRGRGQCRLLRQGEELEIATWDEQDEPSHARDHLYDLLEDAAASGVLDREEIEVLLRLADICDSPVIRRGNAGLSSQAGLRLVGQELGVSGPTVWRRASRALAKLAHRHGLDERLSA